MLIFIILVACNNSGNTKIKEASNPVDLEIQPDSISFTSNIKNESIALRSDNLANCDNLEIEVNVNASGKEINVAVYNNSPYPVAPLHWSVERFSENKWDELRFNVGFLDQFITVEPQDSLIDNIPFSIIDDVLNPGLYRIKQPAKIFRMRFVAFKNRHEMETLAECVLLGYFTIN